MRKSTYRILTGDAIEQLKTLPDRSVQCVVTSPPYYALRDYGVPGQIGLEDTPQEYVARLVEVFREVRRVLRDDGTVFLNLGDSYAANRSYQVCDNKHVDVDGSSVPLGLKPKDMMGIPWRVAFALQDDGWWLRSDIIWAKCLSGGAVVYARSQKGDMPATIKDLARLDPSTVQLWDGDKWNQVLAWNPQRRDGEELELELRNGARIACTRDHRWPTSRGLLMADEVVVGDTIASTTLPEPDTARQPVGLPDADIGWFVGLYIAEGSQSDGTIQIASHAKEAERYARLCRIASAYDGHCAMHRTGGNGATININSPVLLGIIKAYVSGTGVRTKHLHVRCWKRSNAFLSAVLDGYLSGDGHDRDNGRWILGFTNNDTLASDLRCLCARLGVSLRLRRVKHQMDGRTFPGWRGSLYFDASRRRESDYDVVAIRASRARVFYDVVLQDDPHQFALACGALTHNSNPMPESVTDRPTKSHEYIFLLTKSAKYYWDQEAVKEESVTEPHAPGNKSDNGRLTSSMGHVEEPTRLWAANGRRNIRTVWNIATEPYSEAHFATFPTEIPRRCIKAGTSEMGCCPSCGAPLLRVVEHENIGGEKRVGPKTIGLGQGNGTLGSTAPHGQRTPIVTTIGWQPTCDCNAGDPIPCVVLDPFGGSGTTAAVAMELGQDAILCELNPGYVPLAINRIEATIQWIKDGKPGKKPKKTKVTESDDNQLSLLDGLFDHAGIQGEGDC